MHLLFMGLGRKLMAGSVFSVKSEARPSALTEGRGLSRGGRGENQGGQIWTVGSQVPGSPVVTRMNCSSYVC